MKSLDVLRVSGVVPASPERVFRAWTTAEELKRWFGRPEGFEIPLAELDVRVGGSYRIEMEAMDPDSTGRGVIVGTYREVAPSSRLSFTFAWENPVLDLMDTGETLVTVEFHGAGDGTEVLLTHERLRSDAIANFHELGWQNCFDRLLEFLEAERRGR